MVVVKLLQRIIFGFVFSWAADVLGLPFLWASPTTAPNCLCKPHEVYVMRVHWPRPLECTEVVDDLYLPELSSYFRVYLVTPIEILAGGMPYLEVRGAFKHICRTTHSMNPQPRLHTYLKTPEQLSTTLHLR